MPSVLCVLVAIMAKAKWSQSSWSSGHFASKPAVFLSLGILVCIAWTGSAQLTGESYI